MNPRRGAEIRLTGWILVPAEERERVDTLLEQHCRLTLAEAGCVAFSVTPSPDHPDRLTVEECFTDRAAFDAHQRRTATSEWGVATGHLHREYTIATGPA
ncbi:putative quinol monooxygenase [Gordonia hankookensis]|uniref:Antibiotic biosynthesis monooxygenase n=1 Tax=Gordonia hankookensis TaxID=589403 RepID=A0ABR7WK09_9ACTN|nr:antibiotic biosynthesis monooxygenase [Gordonia hankookensis]MBD1322262.1 antibiotic biosynthesis monooxygenase [Gordonia hankookensis]NDZ96838.1 antibiotic biosynthesis monooxygenase [Streptomyces sp. SID11726]NEB26026.1 antibiotic biosynthesis monooxygenase [Streptomyces sp. SID6673]NED61511.1 antibiotic biosynthesis monooxygenase [Streptomyces sp. SID10244]